MGLKILIVDDDPNTVELLQNSMAWEEYGITQVFAAYQGQQALELFRKYEPDIVVSDIEMPRLDGIQLLEELAAMEKKPEVIFLTCHDSFSFAQKALRYGVSDYLLKPFRMEEFAAALLGAVIKCCKNRENEAFRSELEQRRKSQEKNQDYLVQNFVHRLLNKTIEGDTEQLAEAAARRSILFDVRTRYYVLYAGVNMNNVEMEKVTEAEFYFIFRNLSLETVYGNPAEKSAVENTVYPYYILIMPVRESDGDENALKERCLHLIRVSEKYLGIPISCAISPPVYPEEFGALKKQMDGLFLRERTGRSGVLFPGEENKDSSMEELLEQEKALKCLKERKKAEFLETSVAVLHQLEKTGRMDGLHMQTLHHEYMQLFYSFLSEKHVQVRQLFQNEIFTKLHERAEYSAADMIKYVSYLYDLTFEQIDAVMHSDSLIDRAKKYIEENFRKDIDRDEIAAQIFVTPSYLSRIFREGTGMLLREYINICRIEEAKNLLGTTKQSITEVALEVGFNNIPYFSTIFKKYCHMTPAAWKGSLEENKKSESKTEETGCLF